MDDYTPPKPKSIVAKFRLAAAFLIGLASLAIVLAAVPLTAVGMAVSGEYTLRETAEYLHKALVVVKDRLQDDIEYLFE